VQREQLDRGVAGSPRVAFGDPCDAVCLYDHAVKPILPLGLESASFLAGLAGLAAGGTGMRTLDPLRIVL
jgi:hypothetical protein